MRARAMRRDAEIERDQALELTLEVLKRKHGQRGGGDGDDVNIGGMTFYADNLSTSTKQSALIIGPAPLLAPRCDNSKVDSCLDILVK